MNTHINPQVWGPGSSFFRVERGWPEGCGGMSASFAPHRCGNKKSGSVFGWLSWLCSSAFLARTQDHAPRESRLMTASHGKALQRQRAKTRGWRGRWRGEGGGRYRWGSKYRGFYGVSNRSRYKHRFSLKTLTCVLDFQHSNPAEVCVHPPILPPALCIPRGRWEMDDRTKTVWFWSRRYNNPCPVMASERRDSVLSPQSSQDFILNVQS